MLAFFKLDLKLKKITRIIINICTFVLGERRDAVWGPGDQKDSDSGREADLTIQIGRGQYMIFVIKRQLLEWFSVLWDAHSEFLSVFTYLCQNNVGEANGCPNLGNDWLSFYSIPGRQVCT